MKKFIYILLFSLILFIPGNVKAETLDTLDCKYTNSSRPVEETYRCSGLSSSYAEFNEITRTFDFTLKDWTNPYFYVPRAHIFDVEVGPSDLKFGYVFGLSNSGLSNYSYYYNFFKDNIYSLNYTLTVPKGLNLYLNNKYSLLSFSGRITGKDSFSDDVIDNATTVGSFIEDVNSDTTDTYLFSIEFQPKYDLDRLQFYLGFDSTSLDFDVTSNFLFKNDVDKSYKVYVSDFSVTEIDQFSNVIHGGGGTSIDKPTDEDVFSGYKDLTEGVNSCDGVDIGCWFNNLWIVLKNLVFNIGRFFVNILNYLWEVIDYAINILLEPLKHLVDFVLIFWDDFVSFLQDSLKWFYDTFLKGPIDYFIESIKSFFTVDVNGINILLQELNESISSGDNSLSSIITKPLEIIQNLSNSYCTNITFTLPLVNSTVSLPCMTPIYQTYFNTLFVLYQTLTTGFIAYWCLINIFAFVMDFKEPTGDKVEVLKL